MVAKDTLGGVLQCEMKRKQKELTAGNEGWSTVFADQDPRNLACLLQLCILIEFLFSEFCMVPRIVFSSLIHIYHYSMSTNLYP